MLVTKYTFNCVSEDTYLLMSELLNTLWLHLDILVNTDSGNGLSPDISQAITWTHIDSHQQDSMTFIQGWCLFHYSRYQSESVWKSNSSNHSHIAQWPNDAIWWHKSGSTYLHWNSPECKFSINTSATEHVNQCENRVSKSPGAKKLI